MICPGMALSTSVGHACLQISKAVGARVIAVCRGAAKAEALKRLGADEVIDQSAESAPLRSQIKVLTHCTSSHAACFTCLCRCSAWEFTCLLAFPVSAVTISGRVYASSIGQPQQLLRAHTYVGSPASSCAAVHPS